MHSFRQWLLAGASGMVMLAAGDAGIRFIEGFGGLR